MADNVTLDSLRRRLSPGSSVLQVEESGLPIAAVAIIIDPEDQRGSILLIKRTEREGDPWSGQIAFPGGRSSPKDQTFLETAIREAWEEVGVNLQEHELLGMLPMISTRSKRVRVVPYVFQLRRKVVVRTNEEVAESFWVPMSDFEKITPVKTEVNVEEGELTVDAFIYHDRVIWGLTYRIIKILLNKQQLSDT